MISRIIKTAVLVAVISAPAVAVLGAEWDHLGLGNRQIKCLELQQSGTELYLGTDDGIYTFLIGTDTYLPLTQLSGHEILSILSLDADTMLAGVAEGTSAIYRRTPSGWAAYQNDYGGGEFQPAFDLARVPGPGGGLIATGVAVIAKSDDAGQSWREVWGDWANMAMGVVFVQPDTLRPNIVWAGGEAAIFAPWLMKSIDYGETWELLPVYSGGDNRCHDIAVDPGDPDIAWVSMEGLICKTVDGGQHWEDVLANDFYLFAIEIDPNQPWRLYCTGAKAGAPLTLFYSRDYGETWDELTDDNYPANGAYDMLLYPRSYGCDLYAGTDYGLFRYTDDYMFCCRGRVGDVNGDGADEPTLGDIAYLIDFLFISQDPAMLSCLAEADVDQSGLYTPTPDDITIGDISILIDYLFITGPSLGLPSCL